MKILLILFNLLLVGGIGWQAVSLLNDEEPVTVTTKSRTRRAEAKTAPAASESTAPDFDAVLATIAGQNIFDSSRCPEMMSGGSSALVLLGIYRMGDLQGAIFQQRQQRQQRNFRAGPWNNTRNNQNTKQVPLKRFLKVGETLENGYTLEAVYDNYVVLSRSGSTMELHLQRASTNLPSSIAARNQAAARSRPNAQQMQTGMMMRQVQLMEQMVRNQQSQPRQNTNVNRSTRSR